MGRTLRDIDGITGFKTNLFSIQNHFGLSVYDDPMLRSSGMLLIAQAVPGMNPDPFDLMGGLVFKD